MTNEIIFAGECIFIPVKLCHYLLALLDEIYYGMENTKAQARHDIYLPRMSKEIEICISKCCLLQIPKR